MKNSECAIYITLTRSGWTQKYIKGVKSWEQHNPNGIVRQLTAEQLLSHILPILAGKEDFLLKVERNKDI